MSKGLKFYVFLITSAAILVADVKVSNGQTTAFGLRITPSYIPGATVVNPSESNIYGPPKLNVNIGIYGLKYFRNGNFGIRGGLEYGAVPYILGVDAPRSAFGTGAGGGELIHVSYNSKPLSFAALTISPTYLLPLGDRFLEITAGPSVRFYNFPENGFYEYMLAFNRNTPYDPDDPSAGPPDVRTRVTNLDRLYFSLPVSIDYVIKTNRRGQLKLGLLYNISKPLSGELEVNMNNENYQGSFKPRTGFLGVNLQYERLSKKSVSSIQNSIKRPEIIGRYRKALFIETFIAGGFLSANYDMRLKKDTNNGLGFSVGTGLGGHYRTEVTNNNRTTDRRMFALPVGLNYIIGEKQHGIEFGVGVTPQIALDKVRGESANDNGTFFPLRIGYRFQPLREGLIARAAFMPIIDTGQSSSDKINLINFGIALGYSFK